jgi:hypothetical protein
MPVGNRTSLRPTDDQGQFRIFGLSPGSYYISALSGAFAEGSESGGFAPTYYPGTPQASAAQPVSVGVGQQVTELTFQLTPARMARLSGRMLDGESKPVPSGTVTLSLADRAGVPDFFITRTITRPDGSFVLRNVPPGPYTIQGFGRQTAAAGNLGASEFGSLGVTVDGEDHDNLVLSVKKGASLRGRIVAREPGAAFNPRNLSIAALPIEFDSAPVGGGPAPSVINEDGSFEVSNLSGQRLVRVSLRTPGWALDRITRRGTDITDTPLDFRNGDIDDVEIVVTNRIAVVMGGVTDDHGSKISNYAVVLFATNREKWTDRSRFIMLGRPTQDGQFKVEGVPPDEYFAVALPTAPGTRWQDPEFLERLSLLATRFFVSEGEARAITLPIRELR